MLVQNVLVRRKLFRITRVTVKCRLTQNQDCLVFASGIDVQYPFQWQGCAYGRLPFHSSQEDILPYHLSPCACSEHFDKEFHLKDRPKKNIKKIEKYCFYWIFKYENIYYLIVRNIMQLYLS